MPSNVRVSCRFEGAQTMGSVNRFELREAVAKHELCIVDFVYNKHVRVPAEGTPVTVSWVTDGRVRRFNGYLDHIEHLPGELVDYARCVMVGTSNPMKTPDPKTWSGLTASAIAKDIADRHGLRCVLHKTTRLIPFAVANQGDFALLRKLADDEGYLFWVTGATLFFLDPNILVHIQNSQSVVQFVSTIGDPAHRLGNVHEIKSLIGPVSTLDDSAYRQTTYGIGADGRFIKANSQLDIPELSTSPKKKIRPTMAHTIAEAHQANAAAQRGAMWSHQRVIVDGSTDITLGKLANLRGNGVSENLAGIWAIRGATHVIAKDEEKSAYMRYTTEVDMARNSRSTQMYSGTSHQAELSTVDAVLRNGVWESSMLGAVYV